MRSAFLGTEIKQWESRYVICDLSTNGLLKVNVSLTPAEKLMTRLHTQFFLGDESPATGERCIYHHRIRNSSIHTSRFFFFLKQLLVCQSYNRHKNVGGSMSHTLCDMKY